MDKATARALGEDIAEALAPVAEKYGMAVHVGGGKYDTAGSYEPKIKFASPAFAQTEWNRYAPRYGLPLDMVGCTFFLGGTMFVIQGVAPKNRSYPIMVTNEFGESRKMRVSPALVAALEGKVE